MLSLEVLDGMELDGMELDGMDSFPLGVSFPLEGLELDFVIILFLFLIEF